jgi:hypothetical protein
LLKGFGVPSLKGLAAAQPPGSRSSPARLRELALGLRSLHFSTRPIHSFGACNTECAESGSVRSAA